MVGDDCCPSRVRFGELPLKPSRVDGEQLTRVSRRKHALVGEAVTDNAKVFHELDRFAHRFGTRPALAGKSVHNVVPRKRTPSSTISSLSRKKMFDPAQSRLSSARMPGMLPPQNSWLP